MNLIINLNKINFVKYLLIYFIIMLITNYYRISNIIDHLLRSNVSVSMTSVYISSVFTSIFIVLVFPLVILICFYLREIFFSTLKIESIFSATRQAVVIFIVFELVRFLSIELILIDEIHKIRSFDNFINKLNETLWFRYNLMINFVSIIIGAYVFGIKLYDQEEKIIPSIVFSIIFIIIFYTASPESFSWLY